MRTAVEGEVVGRRVQSWASQKLLLQSRMVEEVGEEAGAAHHRRRKVVAVVAVVAAEGEEVPNQTRLGTTRWVVAEEAAVAAVAEGQLVSLKGNGMVS